MTDGLIIAQAALTVALQSGVEALPFETGGILLGFRAPRVIVVTRALVVPDPSRTQHSYLRRARRAQTLLAADRANAPEVIGYVGEWHTHPQDIPPSRIDRRALAASARRAGGPVALVVPAFPADGPPRLHALRATRRHRSTGLVVPVEVTRLQVTSVEHTPESLESEAAALCPRPPGPR